MKTKLPNYISTLDEAKVYLEELCKNGEAYHPDDDATQIVWDKGIKEPTMDEAIKMNSLMDQVWDVALSNDFDIYTFIMEKWDAQSS